MNLITKRVHMNRCNGREVKQLTLDRDFNVPDARPDALQIMKEQGEVQIEEVHMMEGKASVKGLLHFQILYASDGDVGILAVAAAVLVGVAGSQLGALVEMRGLDGEALAGLILVLPVFTDLGDHAAEFMADDCGMLRNVVRDALVILTLDCGLVGRHTDRVGNDLDLNVIRADLRQLDLLQAEVHFAMDTDSFRFHTFHSFLAFTLHKSSNQKWDCVGLY